MNLIQNSRNKFHSKLSIFIKYCVPVNKLSPFGIIGISIGIFIIFHKLGCSISSSFHGKQTKEAKNQLFA